VPRTRVADVPTNLSETIRLARQDDAFKAALMIFPELGLSAYAIDDLLFQDALLNGVERATSQLVEASHALYPILVVGTPNAPRVTLQGRDCHPSREHPWHRAEDLSAELSRILRERRHFASGAGIRQHQLILAGRTAPFDTDLRSARQGRFPSRSTS